MHFWDPPRALGNAAPRKACRAQTRPGTYVATKGVWSYDIVDADLCRLLEVAKCSVHLIKILQERRVWAYWQYYT